MIKKKRVNKIEVTKICDWCGIHDGDTVSDEDGVGFAVVRKARYWAKYYKKGWMVYPRPCSCNHDICSSCWYYPGDLIRCPKCNPDIDKARDEDSLVAWRLKMKDRKAGRR